MKLFYFLLLCVFVVSFLNCEDADDTDTADITITGQISYAGDYTGSNTTIYIRGYTTNSKAVGDPDYSTNISDTGLYSLSLGSYTGDIYLSAFMDADNSGNTGGPSASETMTDSVYSDPLGCYGDYTFDDGGPTKITANASVSDIDIVLYDTGVIKATINQAGTYTLGVVSENVISSEMLHHEHCVIDGTNDVCLLTVPVKDGWYVKLSPENGDPSTLYSSSVDVEENSLNLIEFD